MPLSSAQIGERIVQARKRKDWLQEDLAKAIGVGRTTVVAMEKGERPPSPAELVKIARALSIPVNELLREHTVVADASPRFRMGRRHGQNEAVEQAVEQLKELGRQYVELEQVLSLARKPAPLESISAYRLSPSAPGIDPRLTGQDAAAFLRRHLDLGDSPVLALEPLLEMEAGLRIFHLALPSEVAAIFLWSDVLGACVAVNRLQPRERQRWSLVHELGHFLRDREAGDLLPANLEGRLDPSEIFCEALAAEFLMPAAGVRRRFTEHLHDKGAHFSPADLLAMARFYAVSFQAMTLRLQELQLLPAGTYKRLTQRGFRPSAVHPPPETPLTHDSTASWLPQRYVRLVLEAYDQELLSEGELARYLHCDRITARGVYQQRRVATTEGGDLELDLGADVLQLGATE
jgi:Zn-dependent peptidase ImmA (M78 family)/transcriptional regulator with XRE-family HTH domain